jgi:prepilin-type N-terminal cleavage/methylation domain-containing protein
MPRSAFTLLEVSLVAVLILMLAMIAYPSIESIYGGVRLTAAADLIRARWADARAHAVDEVKPYRFAIVPDSGRFRVAPDTTDFWDRGGLPPDDFDDADTRLVIEDELPKGVKFSENSGSDTGETSGEWTVLVRFRPDGTADKDVEITFNSSGAAPLILKLRGLTGAVTTPRAQPEGR